MAVEDRSVPGHCYARVTLFAPTYMPAPVSAHVCLHSYSHTRVFIHIRTCVFAFISARVCLHSYPHMCVCRRMCVSCVWPVPVSKSRVVGVSCFVPYCKCYDKRDITKRSTSPIRILLLVPCLYVTGFGLLAEISGACLRKHKKKRFPMLFPERQR